MSLSQKQAQAQDQRVSVIESERDPDSVKIHLERFDENLGWYTANSLEIPRSQLPLLEQSLDRHLKQAPDHIPEGTVIPFPTIAD